MAPNRLWVADFTYVSTWTGMVYESTLLDVFDRIVAVNLRGTILMCRHAIGVMRQAGGGSIVNLGSVATLRGVG